MPTQLAPLPVPVERTEEGADYPPIVDYQPGLPGRKNPPPQGSTAELFREFQHFGLRGSWVENQPIKGPCISLPKSCEVIPPERIIVDRPLADCGISKVLLVKLLRDGSNGGARTMTRGTNNANYVPCVARIVREPTRQFWREVGVWSSLTHENIVKFVGVCISTQGPLSVCLHYPEGSVYQDNARLRSSAPSSSPLSWGLRSGWTLVTWVRQLVGAMNYLHGLKPWPVLYRNLKSSNVMLSENHTKINLTDFAICRPLAQHDDVTPAQGSDRWLAPEALLGEQFDLACDVFSFALTCWEFAACDIPYALCSSRQAAMLIVQGLRPTVPPHCPDWLARLMAACNAHVPEARPSFAAIHATLSAPSATDARGLSASVEALLATSEQVMLQRVERAQHSTSATAPPPLAAQPASDPNSRPCSSAASVAPSASSASSSRLSTPVRASVPVTAVRSV